MAVTVVAAAASLESVDTVTHNITLPASSMGNLIVVFFTCDGDVHINVDEAVSGSNWIHSVAYRTGDISSVFAYKVAEASNYLSLITEYAEQSSTLTYVLSGQGSSFGPDYTMTSGSGTNMDPPSLTPSHGSQTYMWLVFGATDGNIVATVAPTNFSSLYTQVGGTSGASSSAAQRLYTTGTAYDPGTFTSASASWITYIVAISPPIPEMLSLGSIAYYNV